MNKRIICTGSAGFIGYNLCKTLKNTGYAVLEIDKKDGNNIHSTEVQTRMLKFKPDVIVHLAGIPSIKQCEAEPFLAYIDNVNTTDVMSDIALKTECPIFFASSQAAKNPESSHYANHKNQCEEILHDSNIGYIMRFSNVYGGLKYIDKKDSVIAKFMKAHMMNEPLIINGNGTQGRDFLHLDDLIKVIISLFDWIPSKMHTIDVGTGTEVSITDVAKMFGNTFKYDSDSSMVGVESNHADVDMLRNIIGYIPKLRLESWVKEHIT